MRKVKRKIKAIKITIALLLLALLGFLILLWYFWDYYKKYNLVIQANIPNTLIYLDDVKVAMYGEIQTRIRVRRSTHTIMMHKKIDDFSYYEIIHEFIMPEADFSLKLSLEKKLTKVGHIRRRNQVKKENAKHLKELQAQERLADAQKMRNFYALQKKKEQREKAQKRREAQLRLWKRKFASPKKGIQVDDTNAIAWQKKSTYPMTYAQAKNYCSQLKISGVKYWSLPSKENLKKLDLSPEVQTSAPLLYWSSNSFGLGTTFAMAVNIKAKSTHRKKVTQKLAVKCSIASF